MIILVVKQASSSMLEWILLVLLIWQVTNNGIKKKLYFDLENLIMEYSMMGSGVKPSMEIVIHHGSCHGFVFMKKKNPKFWFQIKTFKSTPRQHLKT